MVISLMNKYKAEMDRVWLQGEDCNFLKGWSDQVHWEEDIWAKIADIWNLSIQWIHQIYVKYMAMALPPPARQGAAPSSSTSV